LFASSSASNESCSHFVAIAGLANRHKTSESIWLYPVFAFVCYVSIHLGNFCGGRAIFSTGTPYPNPHRKLQRLQDSVAAVQMRLINLDQLFIVRTASMLAGREPSHLVLSR
jgi:hypothetical protein